MADDSAALPEGNNAASGESGVPTSVGKAATEPETTARIRVAVRNDVHHLVQLVIGELRMYSEGGYDAPDRAVVRRLVERLRAVLSVVDAIGDDEARAAMAGTHGLATPSHRRRMHATPRTCGASFLAV